MKLTYKFAALYLLITLVILVIGGVITFYNIKTEVDQEQARYLRHRINLISKEINRGVPIDSLTTHEVDIRVLPADAPAMGLAISDTMVWHDYLHRKEPEVKLSVSKKINGKHYYISTHDSMIESDDITEAVLKSLIGIYILFLIITGLLTLIISKYLLSPFHKTLQAIQSFRLKQKPELVLPQTSTVEFKKLNGFLKQMTGKAQQDYLTLKEFTDNASHELRTPLAIIRGKLELLLNTNIDDQQAKLIVSAHNSLETLSKMSQSLALLSKLDNQEFESPEAINISQRLKDNLFAFQELIEMKHLHVEKTIAEDVVISMHPVLADILINNLLSNAIRHNQREGSIQITLTRQHLVISNTGKSLDISPEEMFVRFKKNNQSADSVGLGLSIVKQICNQSNIRIHYEYNNANHHFNLIFNQKK